MHFESEDTSVVVSDGGRSATLTQNGTDSQEPATITATIDEPASGRFAVTTPVIKPPQHPVGDLRKLVIVLDPKAESKLQVSFALPGTAPLPSPVNPLEHWSSEGVLGRLKSDDAAGESTYRCDNGQRGPPGSAELAAQLDNRPAFHFYPDTIESQDISGPIKINEAWHVFMDCVPEGCPALVQPVQDKPLSWCHFSSRDLVHWAERPIAIAPDHPFGKI